MKKSSTIKIGKNIQKIRKSFGYTQERLAEETDMSTRYISDVEQDRAKPSYEVLIKICNIFNVGLDDIFSEHLDNKGRKSLDYTLAGFENMSEENKKTVEHLIMFFNKEKK